MVKIVSNKVVAGKVVTKTVAAKVATRAVKSPPQGRAETAAERAANETTGGIVPLKKSALSLDVGPRVIHAMFSAEARVGQLVEELHTLRGVKRYEQLSELTLAVAKAARADTSIDLAATYSGDKKAMERLNDQLGIALGFREIKGTVDRNGLTYEAVVTAKAVGDCFPLPGETRDTVKNFDQKNTFRSNFMTQLKKCAQAAHGLIEQKIEAKLDTKSGTLMISGPAVKKHFGQDRVLLDERQTIGTGDAAVKLSEKPSFQALANIGAATQGVAPAAPGAGGAQHRGKQSGTVGGTLAQQAVKVAEVTGKESLDAAIVTICKALRTALEKTQGALSKGAAAALEETKNAIEVKLAS
jgi:hypothetical protein